MNIKESTKQEIEAKMNSMHDFVRMEYLENCLKQGLSFDVRKFVLLKLVEIYENKKMFNEAAKNINSAADIVVTYREKVELYLREVELYVKAGTEYFNEADKALNKALACANNQEKNYIKQTVKKFYLKQAQAYEESQKPTNALKTYEKALTMEGDENSQAEIKGKILPLYERLGKIREYFNLKNQIN